MATDNLKSEDRTHKNMLLSAVAQVRFSVFTYSHNEPCPGKPCYSGRVCGFSARCPAIAVFSANLWEGTGHCPRPSLSTVAPPHPPSRGPFHCYCRWGRSGIQVLPVNCSDVPDPQGQGRNPRKGETRGKFHPTLCWVRAVSGPFPEENLVAQCSATPATVAATPPCSATPFQTQISVRHLPGHGGGQGATPKFLRGVARHRCYTCKTL